jgi:hypothetical protein
MHYTKSQGISQRARTTADNGKLLREAAHEADATVSETRCYAGLGDSARSAIAFTA